MRRDADGARVLWMMALGIAVPCLLPDAPLMASNAASTQAPASAVPITYVRCPRTQTPIVLSGEVTIDGQTSIRELTLIGADGHDVLPDVSNFLGDFSAPCDLIYRAADGSERVLYDCSSNPDTENACAAMDPAVSFDGRSIAFAVFRGRLRHSPQVSYSPRTLDPAATNNASWPYTYPNRVLRTSSAQLHVVDVASGAVRALPQPAAVFDTGPAWLSDGRIAFTSTRLNIRRANVPTSTSSKLVAQLWTMDADGRNARPSSPHALGGYEHPLQLRDGRLLFSSWQGFGTITFRKGNNGPGSFGTIDNFFNLYAETPDGSNTFSLFGQHGGSWNAGPSIGGAPPHLAAHFIAQASDGRIWTADYYRENNNGLGLLYGFMPPADGQEGWGPDDAGRPDGHLYMPRDWIRGARWDSNWDETARPTPVNAPLHHPSYSDPLAWQGKLGHPAALPGNDLLVTWGKGACSTVAKADVYNVLGLPIPPGSQGTGAFTVAKQLTGLGRDNPSCDAGLYRLPAVRIPSQSPADLELIVDTREWHEFMARAVVPYAALFGVEKPAVLPRPGEGVSHAELPRAAPFGLLGAASIINRETHPVDGIHFAGERQFAAQGTDTINYADADLCGVRMLGILPNRPIPPGGTALPTSNLSGERVVILGEFPVRNFRNGVPIIDSQGHPDTSFLFRMPADVPYLMQAIDCSGRTLNTDQTWQGVRPGEIKTCNGCHVHGREAGIDFHSTRAAEPDYPVARLASGEVSLLAGGSGQNVQRRQVPGFALQLEFERDIQPFLIQRCASCHGGSSPAGNFAVDRPGLNSNANGATPSTWWCLVRDLDQLCVPPAQRMQTSSSGSTRFRRPQVSRYVRAFNALGSLLYWKAAGQRTDGNTDDTYNQNSPIEDRDLDFGPPHPSHLTADELGLLSRWIDIGAPAGAGHRQDTLDPTLTLAASVEAGAITRLHVGTVDVPSGINTASLSVCVLPPGGACGPNLAGIAHASGVATINLAQPLNNPDQEVRAEVNDLAGNRRSLQLTVGELMRAAGAAPGLFASGFEG
jgi:hypothetical protein